MQRKVIQLAGKTLVVSLPSKWAKKNNIEKGDDIEIEEEEKRIILSTGKERIEEKRILDTKELGHYNPHYIAYMYQTGIDEIRINYQDRKILKQIQDKIADLMGYEIVDQGQDFVEIKNVSSALEEEFETLLRRTFYLLKEMGKGSLEAIKNNNKEQLKGIIELENSVDKFTDFCKRVLNKRGYKDHKKTQFYYVIIRDLEKIGDYYEEISRARLEQNTKISKETTELYEEANKFLTLFHQLFYKFDKENANKFQEKKIELKKKVHDLMKKAGKEDLLIIYYLASMIKTTGNLYGPYYSTII